MFLTLALILAKFVFKKYDEILLGQNLGHNHVKKCKISCLVGLLNEKQVSTICPFQTPLTLLTYSALVRLFAYCRLQIIDCGFRCHLWLWRQLSCVHFVAPWESQSVSCLFVISGLFSKSVSFLKCLKCSIKCSSNVLEVF